MTLALSYADAAFAVLKRDFLVFFSYRTRIVSQIASVALVVVLFYYVSRLVAVEEFESPDQYFAFALVGIVTMRGLATTFSITVQTLRQELVAGTFERMVASPFGATAGAISMISFPLVLAFVLALLILTMAVVLFGLQLEWSTAPLALPLAGLAALAFAPFALMIAAASILFKQAAGIVGFFLAGIAVTAGVFFPVDLLPAWLRWASEVQPFTPTLELMRHWLVGIPVDEPLWQNLATIAGFAAVLLPVSFFVLRGAIKIGRRRATITEY